MITTLHIKNVGIIDDLTINLDQGLNVLTGETGAGKTLIIDSLGIICGGRFSKEMIRRGEDHSFVEMCLYLPKDEKAVDGNVIISREISNTGRNLCKINGRMVTVAELKEYMNHVINIHGQNDNQNILNKESHIKYLDAFISSKILPIKQEYMEEYELYIKTLHELNLCYGDDKEKQRKVDLLEYQLNEISNANLSTEEEEELEIKRNKMMNAEKIISNLSKADANVNEGALENLGDAIHHLEKIEHLSDEYAKYLSSLKSIYYDLQETARDLSCAKEDVDFDEEERKELEDRLDLIFSLKRKYGNTTDEILEYEEKVRKEIDEINHLEERRNSLKDQLEKVTTKMDELSLAMSNIRKEYAKDLSEKINEQLTDLEMKNATFEVKIDYTKKEYQKDGCDRIEFLICTNVGEEAKELIKIASGGEMSRIMLAIKTVLANVDEVPVLVFDEIDTGISGMAANSVADKLKKIGSMHQVITVTHLGAIAAKGDSNYKIYKEVEKEKTKTKIDKLKEEDILKEIARITSGNITEVSIKHAMELRRAVS